MIELPDNRLQTENGTYRLFSVVWAILLVIIMVMWSVPVIGQTNTGKVSMDSVGYSSQMPGEGDLDSRGMGLSSEDSARNRPPKPVKVHEDNHYPEGFLDMSKPAPVINKPVNNNEPTKVTPTDLTKEPTGAVIPQDDTAPNYEKIVHRDQSYILGILVAAALFGIFAFLDYRYRCWVQTVVMQNNRLLSPDVTSTDFEELLFGTSGVPLESAVSGLTSAVSGTPGYNGFFTPSAGWGPSVGGSGFSVDPSASYGSTSNGKLDGSSDTTAS